ncbi:MAG: acyl-CoA thioesterase [Burkholderiales bacterium]
MADADRKLLFSLAIPVRWGDLDANNHVNNATYFTYCEQARVVWLESLGAQNTAGGQGPVVVQTACEYLKPIPYPETIEVRVYGGAPGRSSFPTFYEISAAGNTATLYAKGQAIMVWTDRATGKSCPLPDDLRKRLG